MGGTMHNWAEEVVGGYVVAKYANNLGEHGSGRVVAYCAQPTFIIEQADGTRFSWRTDMCKPIDPPAQPLSEADLEALDQTYHRGGQPTLDEGKALVAEVWRLRALVSS